MNNALSQGEFPRTRWSLANRLDAPGSDEARAVLGELARCYWYPVYAYVRMSGHAPAVAQDIAHAFFRQLPRHYADGHAATRGSFRVWLLGSLRAFLECDWRELACGDAIAGVPAMAELERRYQCAGSAAHSPARAFHVGFAMEVLSRGCRSLCAEAHAAGHRDMFEELRPFLARDPLPEQYAAMHQRLGSRPPMLAVALRCLRLRLRELVRGELANTVSSGDEMFEEQRALYGILRGDG